MRIALILPLLLLLAACNNHVVSETPWFTRSVDGPRLKPGLWMIAGPAPTGAYRGCRFDERKPAYTWPACAEWYVVRDSDLLRLKRTEASWYEYPDYDWDRTAYVLAPGALMISQTEGCKALNIMYEPGPDGGMVPLDPSAYCYDALRPTRFDAEGRITAVLTWPIFCGPWAPDEQGIPNIGSPTVAPFPGLHMVHDNCTAESEEALRQGAASSEAIVNAAPEFGPRGLGPSRVAARWVRDDYR
jgi:hypothetical protein